MKKLIAILVVFALLTGAAFAQVTLGASAWAGATLVYGNSESKEGPFAAPGLWEEDEDGYWQNFGATLSAAYETPGGEAGVSFVIKVDGNQDSVRGTDIGGTIADAMAYAEYEETLKAFKIAFAGVELAGVDWDDPQYADYLLLKDEPPTDPMGALSSGGGPNGTNPSAIFDSFGAWWWAVPGLLKLNMGQAGFDRGDATPFHYIEGSGNWFGITIQPVDMFALNVSFLDEGRWGYRGFVSKKFEAEGGNKDGFGEGTLGDNFGNVFMLQAIAQIDGIGEVGFTFDNWYMADGWWELDAGDNYRGVFVDFNGEFVGVGVVLGFSYLMGVDDYGTKDLSAWGFGIGVSYGLADMIGMDLTVGFSFDVGVASNKDGPKWDKNGGPAMAAGLWAKLAMPIDPFVFNFGFSMDFFNLSGEKGLSTAYLEAMKKDKDMVMEWEVNLGLSREIGGFTFNAGLDIDGNNGEKTGVNYAVPIKFSYAW